MARKGITYDQVANAAETIRARGLEPTITAIRQEIGEGSFTTISLHLSKWREKALEATEQRELPKEVENRFLEAMTTIWNVAVAEAQKEVKAIKQQQEDEKEKDQQTIKEAQEEILKLEEIIQRMEEELQKSIEKAAKSEKTMTALNGELDATKKLYNELLNTIKQPAVQTPKAGDTKPEHQTKTKAEPGNKPA